MASSPPPAEDSQLTLLSLPDDILVRVFKDLCPSSRQTIHSSVHALHLAHTNTRLRRIFSKQLTRITPDSEDVYSERLFQCHYRSLIEIARENLLELNIPSCASKVVERLPELCPNLKALSYFCIHADETDSESGKSAAEDPDSSDGADDGNDNENDEDPGEAGVEDVGDYGPSDDEASRNDDNDIKGGQNQNQAGVQGASDSENSFRDGDSAARESVKNGTSGFDENKDDDKEAGADGREPVELVSNEEKGEQCPIIPILARLKLQKVSVTRFTRSFVDAVQPLIADQILQELQFHAIKRQELALLTPLFAEPLKSLTITIENCDSTDVSGYLDALIEAVPNIPSVTVQVPRPIILWSSIEKSVNLNSLDFPAEAGSIIRSVRERNCESECKSINLAGKSTFGLLAGVDRNASITLSIERITVCDHGEGTHITSLPLYDEFLDEDIGHLEKAYILERPEFEGGAIVEYKWSDEWRRRLAGRRLRVIRSFDANVLNRLELSTESLELFYTAIPNVTNWSFLNGVRELYLIGAPPEYPDRDEAMIHPFLKLLPQLVNDFQGELFWMGLNRLDTSEMVENGDLERVWDAMTEIKEAIDLFARRGGDAATVRTFLDFLSREYNSLVGY